MNVDGTFVLPPKKRKIKSPKPKKRSEPLRDHLSPETLGNFCKSPFPGNFGGGDSPFGGSTDEMLEKIRESAVTLNPSFMSPLRSNSQVRGCLATRRFK